MQVIETLRMKKHRGYSMAPVYQLAGISRQAHHQQRLRKKCTNKHEQEVLTLVGEWRKSHPRMGSRQVYYGLVQHGAVLGMGINKFEQFMSRHGLSVGPARRKHPLTSDGKGKTSFQNLTHGLIINDINELIVGDITYFDIRGCWHYVFTLKDVYSQRIVGLHAADTMESKHLIYTLNACVNERGADALQGCIHHSDNGSQYNSHMYLNQLDKLKMVISRAEGCQQNGSAEQLNHIVKNMYLNHWPIHSLNQLRQACKQLQYLNNHQRPIAQLGNKTPVAFERYLETLPKKEKPKKKMHDFTK